MEAGWQERQVPESENPARVAFREALEAAKARGRAYGGVLAQLETARQAAEDPAAFAPVAPRAGGGTDRLSLVAGQMKLSPYLVDRIRALAEAHARDEARLRDAEEAVARFTKDPELQLVFAADAKLDELFAAFKDAEADFADYPALLTLLRTADAPPEPAEAPPEDLGPFLVRRPSEGPPAAPVDPDAPAEDAPAPAPAWHRWAPLADGLAAALVLAAAAWALRAAPEPAPAEVPVEPAQETAYEEPMDPEDAMERFNLAPLTLELGLDLVPLVDPGLGGELMPAINAVRNEVIDELGLILPGVQFKDNLALKAKTYRFLRRGQVIAEGTAYPDLQLAVVLPTTDTTDPVMGLETTDPVDGRPAAWVAGPEAEQARRYGYQVRPATIAIAAHVGEAIRAHAAEILFLDSVVIMCNRMRDRSLIMDEVLGFGPGQPNRLEVAELAQVLQLLLAERVSIRDFQGILEAIAQALRPARSHHYADAALFHDHLKTPDIPTAEIKRRLAESLAPELNPIQLLPQVRRALARQLSASVADADRQIQALLFRPGVADALHDAVRRNPLAPERSLLPETRDRLLRSLVAEVEGMERPVLVVDPEIRWAVRRVAGAALPRLQILASDEVDGAYSVVPAGYVALVDA